MASPGSHLPVYGPSPQLHFDSTCSGETCAEQTSRLAFMFDLSVQLKTEVGLRKLLACHLVAKPIQSVLTRIILQR